MMAAKSDEAHWGLAGQFKRHEVRKTYLALIDGPPDLGAGKTDFPSGQKEIQAEAALLRYDREADPPPNRLAVVHPMAGRRIRLILRFIPHHHHAPVLPSARMAFRASRISANSSGSSVRTSSRT